MPPLGNGKKWSNCLNFGRRDASFFSFFRNCHSFRPTTPGCCPPARPARPAQRGNLFLSRTKANDSKQHQTQVSQRLNCSMIKTITRIRPLKPFQRGVPESEGTIWFLALPRFSLSPPSSSPSLSLSLYLSLSPSLSRKEMKLVSGLSDVTLRES